ncbi:anti-sigma factor [Pseudonocardia sp.]|uniref:anti-sigma factor n=1 Tax=Pseudonocardia sp. TaxID=60912 RepID=UPI003D150CD4
MNARHALPDGFDVSRDRELLGAYLLDLADADERRRVEHRLAADAAYRREMEELREMTDLLGEVPPEAFLDGPPDADLVLQRALHRIRDEHAARRRRRLAGIVAVAAIALGAVLAGGVLVGRATAPPQTVLAQPAPPPTGGRVLSGGNGPVAMTATLTPAAGWVRVAVSVVGIPRDERCQVIVVSRDGRREIAAGWVVSAQGETAGTTLSGSASVAPTDVAAVVVANEAGREFVSLPA